MTNERSVTKSPLVVANGFALLLLAGMSDLEPSMRLGVAGVVVFNLALLIGKDGLVPLCARVGARLSLVGFAGTVGSWLLLALGCGIEYYNARCDAIVTPLIVAFVILTLVSLPIGRAISLFSRHGSGGAARRARRRS